MWWNSEVWQTNKLITASLHIQIRLMQIEKVIWQWFSKRIHLLIIVIQFEFFRQV